MHAFLLQEVPELYPEVSGAMRDQPQAEERVVHAMVSRAILAIDRICRSETDEDNELEMAVPPRTRAQYISDLKQAQVSSSQNSCRGCTCA